MKTMRARVAVTFLLLVLAASVHAQSVLRGPYLQQLTDTSVIVRWRTSQATDSRVWYGTAASSITAFVSEPGSRTEHSVLLNGLAPATTYFYAIGDGSGTLAGDTSFRFETAPSPGEAAPTRIWVIGDSGTANSNAAAVRDAYTTWSASRPADFMIMLGDNAYNSGTDAEYQLAVFDMYPQLLRQLPVWSTLGNHDGYSADSATQSGPYYDIFDLPTAGEAGGLASGTEAYYSFDYGNIHFICLDSYETDRSVGGNMLQWLESDLAFNDKPWVIAFWHHPPYTKGSHDSDRESALIDMRQNALPILEAWGVDLVLSGHSHSYERSFLLDGHYGNSLSLDPYRNVLNPGDGRIDGNGAYQKPGIVAAENAGAVYAVAGSSGKVSSGSLDHPAMIISLMELGSMVLDVNGDRLDAVFIDSTGAVHDEFTLIKTPDQQPPLVESVIAEDAYHVRVDFTERVEVSPAGEPANYSISGLNVIAATVLDGNRSVRLETATAMQAGLVYTLGVANIPDESGNVIADNTSQDFVFQELATVSFQDGLSPTPDYMGTKDTYIREASPTVNYGHGTTLLVDGEDGGGDMNALLAWDLGYVPVAAIVESATIHLNVRDPGGPYGCYALRAPWAEYEANWTDAAAGDGWAVPGAAGSADRDIDPLCTFSASATGALSIPLGADGLALVQSWIDGSAPNHGFLLADGATTNGADFDSSESGSAMLRPRLEITYRVSGSSPNLAPVASFTHLCAGLNCNFSDTSFDPDPDGSIVSWSWDFGDGSGSTEAQPVHDYVEQGEYLVELTVYDDDGATGTVNVLVQVTAPVAGKDNKAIAEIAGGGTVTGDYTSTFVEDGSAQVITERSSGGRKQSRYSYLEHTWVFDLPTSALATLYTDMSASASTDGDSFKLYWSLDDRDYVELTTVPVDGAGALLPLTVGGAFYLQVRDTDQTAGKLDLDSITVDYLYIRTEAPQGDPPAAPGNLVAAPAGPYSIELTWTDNSTNPQETGFRIQRSLNGIDFEDVSSVGADITAFIDEGRNPATTYEYQVYAFNSAGNSGFSNIATATTDQGISLTLSGSKVKGEHVVDVTWSGVAGEARLLRDDVPILDIGPDEPAGTYQDSTGRKGGGTYVYQVCETSSNGNCSEQVSISF